jgi:hypothetical protein
MTLRLLWLASLALVLFGLHATVVAKTGCGIDPNGEPCKPRPGASASADGGSAMDPNGG